MGENLDNEAEEQHDDEGKKKSRIRSVIGKSITPSQAGPSLRGVACETSVHARFLFLFFR